MVLASQLHQVRRVLVAVGISPTRRPGRWLWIALAGAVGRWRQLHQVRPMPGQRQPQPVAVVLPVLVAQGECGGNEYSPPAH